jgi:hypothetical protein
MEMDENLQESIKIATEPLIKSVAAGVAVSAASAIIAALVVTNYKTKNLTGDTELTPTKDETSMSKVETSAKDTDASLAKDEVTAKDGDLSAMKTDAAASNGEATAMDGGATAARTKAGAADIETKALKMT